VRDWCLLASNNVRTFTALIAMLSQDILEESAKEMRNRKKKKNCRPREILGNTTTNKQIVFADVCFIQTCVKM
jgi:hypothetical protein